MFFKVKLVITNFKIAIFIDSNGFWSQFRKKVNLFSLINLNEKFNGFENVIFFHELLTVFLKCDELIEGNEVMIGFNKVVRIIEVFVNL